MKFKITRILLLCMVVLFAVAVTGCEKEGDVEKAGKKIDRAFKSVKDSLKKATD